MKYTCLAAILLSFTLSATAQIESGSKFINGTVRLTLVGANENVQTAFAFNPTLGYFINDNTAVGGSLGIISQSSGNNSRSTTISLSPFIRRYFSIVDNTFYLFLDGTFGLSYGNSAVGFGDFSSTTDAFSVSLSASPGFVFFPAERWSLDFTLTGVALSFYGIGSEGGTTTLFTLGATTFSPSLGFSYYF